MESIGSWRDGGGFCEYCAGCLCRESHDIEWISENEPVDRFDFNRNAQVDFDDVVVFFEGVT